MVHLSVSHYYFKDLLLNLVLALSFGHITDYRLEGIHTSRAFVGSFATEKNKVTPDTQVSASNYKQMLAH